MSNKYKVSVKIFNTKNVYDTDNSNKRNVHASTSINHADLSNTNLCLKI